MPRVESGPQVGIVMGSDSDWDIMQHAAEQLTAFGVTHEAKVLSAHRMPDDTFAYAESAASRGLACIIAGAGGAAHLAGVIAAKTMLPSPNLRIGRSCQMASVNRNGVKSGRPRGPTTVKNRRQVTLNPASRA